MRALVLTTVGLLLTGCWDLDRLTHLYGDSSALGDGLTPSDAGCTSCDAALASPDGGCTRCDGQCTDLTDDPHHCGSCELDCAALPGVRADAVACVAGSCVLTNACATGRAQCNDSIADGCETELTSPATCGGCDTTCPSNAPLCAPSADGWTCSDQCNSDAPDRCGSTCTQFATDPLHCGSCAPCPTAANATATCTGGVCGVACNIGFHDCGGQCVSNLGIASCGDSCTTCPAIANGTPTCDGTACGIQCNFGFHLCGKQCVDDESVASCGLGCSPCVPPADATATCNGAACDFTCNPPYTRVGASCKLVGGRVVFVTSVKTTGSRSGLAGADSLCQARAVAAGLSGSFRAWLSDRTVGATARLTHSTAPYVLTDGTMVAANWSDLTDGTLLRPIDHDELGQVVLDAPGVWTGSWSNGEVADVLGYTFDCTSWTANSDQVNGWMGNLTAKDATWSDNGASHCNALGRLYCVEQ